MTAQRTIDTSYEDLLADVLAYGSRKDDRTGTGTLSRFGAQLRFDLHNGFPLITTKKVFTRAVIAELLWFLTGRTNIGPLLEQDVHIWDEWADSEGNLGPVYGAQWRAWQGPDGTVHDQIADVMQQLVTNPHSRRMVVSAWNVADLPKMALAPCHALFQFDATDGRLSCQLYQRSADLFLGVPFNIASYALLTHMVAAQVGLDVGDFIWTGGDCHIYLNHLDQVTTQLARDAYPFPTLRLDDAPSLLAYTPAHIHIDNYQHHPAIKAPVAV